MKASHLFFLTILTALLLGGCTKAPINGNLDGQWQVVEVIPKPSEEIIGERIYYNFSLHVCMLSYYGGTFLFANMEYDGETLYLDFAEDKTEEDAVALRQYGILNNPISFSVKFTDSHHLTLSSENSQVVLVKH